MSKEVTITKKSFNQVITKVGDPNALTFKTIDSKALVEINEWMPEVNRAVNAFNKQNSQTTLSLMTLSMLESGTYRVLRQILAQVENKRAALKEAIYNIEKKKIEYKDYLNRKDDLTDLDELEMAKTASDIVDSQGHIEAALKEIYALKQRYEEICKNKNVPENWDESHFEDEEVEHHIKCIFRNMVRDRMQGSHNMGSMEYSEQFGIHPVLAYACVDQYLDTIRTQIKQTGQGPDITSLHRFYDDMFVLFKDEYKKAAARLGLDNIQFADSLFKENV